MSCWLAVSPSAFWARLPLSQVSCRYILCGCQMSFDRHAAYKALAKADVLFSRSHFVAKLSGKLFRITVLNCMTKHDVTTCSASRYKTAMPFTWSTCAFCYAFHEHQATCLNFAQHLAHQASLPDTVCVPIHTGFSGLKLSIVPPLSPASITLQICTNVSQVFS